MRIAVFSDIHGNPFACKAVLDSIKNGGYFDAVIAAGDLCLGGSDPTKCVDLLRDNNALCIYGNTDQYIYNPDRTPGDEAHLKKWAHILQTVYWNQEDLGEERINWLAELPFMIRYSPGVNPKDDLVIFHAHPKSLEGVILPSPETQINLFGSVSQNDDDPRLSWMLEDISASTLAFGHFHFTNTRVWNGTLLVNVSPCSLPDIDKDPRARYTIFEWGKSQWKTQRCYVTYDIHEELSALAKSGMPDWETYANTFT